MDGVDVVDVVDREQVKKGWSKEQRREYAGLVGEYSRGGVRLDAACEMAFEDMMDRVDVMDDVDNKAS